MTILTWVKEQVGTGVWLRGQTEHAILAVRGKPIQPLKPESTLLCSPCTGTHSTKPTGSHALVERLCPGSKVEIFAVVPDRAGRPGGVNCGGRRSHEVRSRFDALEPKPLFVLLHDES